jgi:hypothetical protein
MLGNIQKSTLGNRKRRHGPHRSCDRTSKSRRTAWRVCCPRRAALAGAAPSGSCTSFADPTEPRGLSASAKLISQLQSAPTQQKIAHLVVALQQPQAFLRNPPPLHTVAMQRSVQPPPSPQEGKRPVSTHRPLQVQAKDVRQVRIRSRRAQPPLRGRDGRLPSASSLTRVLLAQKRQAAPEIIEAIFNLALGGRFPFGAMHNANVQALCMTRRNWSRASASAVVMV